MHRARPLLGSIIALAMLVAAAWSGAGGIEVALCAAPLLVLGGLLLCGCFVGEDRIVRRRCDRAPSRARRVRRRVGVPHRFAPPSLLERSPASRRGPPVALAPLAA